MLRVHKLEHEVICCIHEIFCVSGGIIFLNTPFHRRECLHVPGFKILPGRTVFMIAYLDSILTKFIKAFTLFFWHIKTSFLFFWEKLSRRFAYLLRKYCSNASLVICDTLLPVRFFSATSFRSSCPVSRIRIDSPWELFFFIGSVHLYWKNWFVTSFCKKRNTFALFPRWCSYLNIGNTSFATNTQ